MTITLIVLSSYLKFERVPLAAESRLYCYVDLETPKSTAVARNHQPAMEIQCPSQPACFFAAVEQANELYSARRADGIGVARIQPTPGIWLPSRRSTSRSSSPWFPQLGEEDGPICPRDVRTQLRRSEVAGPKQHAHKNGDLGGR